MQSLKLKDIISDQGTQQREILNKDIVAEYAEAMRCGAKFPPVKVFFDSVNYFLADGFHRFEAQKSAEIYDINVDIVDGTRRGAILYSTGANSSHGLRLSNADKRKAVMVMLHDKEWAGWSNNAISKHCKVTHTFVNNLRKSVETVSTHPLEPAPVIESEKKLSTGSEGKNGVIHSEEDKAEQYDPKETELQEAHDTINHLNDENERLRDAISSSQLPDEEIISAAELIESLRKNIRTLEAELDAVKSSRDIYQRENKELKKQCEAQRNQLKKENA